MDRHTIELIERFRLLDTSCISDALDSLGIKGCLQDLHPILPSKKICGPAYTVHYISCEDKKLPSADYIDDVEEGSIIVIDNSGRLDCSVWGDIMTLAASQKKIGGTLINGACRDLSTLKKLDYPVFAKGHSTATGRSRVKVDSLCVPVSVTDVLIRPGDLIIADDTGAIVVPLNHAKEVLQAAEDINNKENEIVKLLKTGKSLKKAIQLYSSADVSKRA